MKRTRPLARSSRSTAQHRTQQRVLDTDNTDWLHQLGNKLKIKDIHQWKKVPLSEVTIGFKKKVPFDTFVETLRRAYPEEEWHPWQFDCVPVEHWEDINNQRQYFDWLANELGIKKPEHWYRIRSVEFHKRGGYSVLANFYDGSFVTALQTIYPDVDWEPWLFDSCPRSFWYSPRNRRKYADWLADQFGMDKMEQWYQLKFTDFRKRPGGLGFLRHFKESIVDAVTSTYPEVMFSKWLFAQLPDNFWDVDNKKHQIQFVDSLMDQLGIQTQKEWYNVSITSVLERGGKGFLALYDNSIINALAQLYPQYIWEDEPENQSRGYWQHHSNQRRYFDLLAEQLGIETDEEWYAIQPADIANKGGATLMFHYYHSSVYAALQTVYSEFRWYPWLFQSIPKEYWKYLPNQRAYFDWLADKLQIRDLEDWFKYSVTDVRKHNGGGLLLQYKGRSLAKILEAVYPEKAWCIWLRGTVPRSYWKSVHNQRKFFDWFAKEHGITEPTQWYNISREDVAQGGGIGVLSQYSGSLAKALTAIYPNEKWYPWMFGTSPHNYWKDPKNFKEYADWLCKKLQIKQPEDWYRVPVHQIVKFKGGAMLRNGGLPAFLRKLYPDMKWRSKMFQSLPQGKSQAQLTELARVLFSHCPEIHINFKHPQLMYSDSRAPMEIDVFIPSISLGLEFQGQHHYHFNYMFGDPSTYKSKDKSKKEACEAVGITLIEIPYWWDHTKESLIATIHERRPDIFPDPGPGKPIPKECPFRRVREHPDVRLLQFHKYDNSDPTGCLLSPHYDGPRLIWNGSTFQCDDGSFINVPETLLNEMPESILDGILSCDRQQWEQIRAGDDTDVWSNVKFMVLDAPARVEPIEKRLEFVRQLQMPRNWEIVDTVTCKNSEHLQSYLQESIRNGGIGVLLRTASSYYVVFEKPAVMLVENVVTSDVKVLATDGKRTLCLQPNGKVINTTIADKSISVGDIISVRNDSVNNDVLVGPQLVRVKFGVSWNTILQRHYPYFVSTKTNTHGVSMCHGCKKQISKKMKYRIYVWATYTTRTYQRPHITRFTFCPDPNCVQHAISNGSTSVYLPPFPNVLSLQAAQDEDIDHMDPFLKTDVLIVQ